MSPVRVRLRRLEHGRDLPLPDPATASSSGYDLRAALVAPLTLVPSQRSKVPTGVAIELPQGWEAQIRPRSGLAADHGVTVLNAPGTIDADYRGEVSVILINLGSQPVEIRRGDRIAQIVVARVAGVLWEEAEVLSDSARGGGGFGSTGRS